VGHTVKAAHAVGVRLLNCAHHEMMQQSTLGQITKCDSYYMAQCQTYSCDRCQTTLII